MILFTTISCKKKTPKEILKTDNVNFKVEKLFTVDSISVYRFYDNGNPHYFSKDWTITTIDSRHNDMQDIILNK
jgi:hypothetical protein